MIVVYNHSYLKRPEVIQSHFWYAEFAWISSEKVMNFVNVIEHQLMSKSRTRFHVLHFCPIMMPHVLILVNTRPLIMKKKNKKTAESLSTRRPTIKGVVLRANANDFINQPWIIQFQLVEHRAVLREVLSSTPAGPTLRVLT